MPTVKKLNPRVLKRVAKGVAKAGLYLAAPFLLGAVIEGAGLEALAYASERVQRTEQLARSLPRIAETGLSRTTSFSEDSVSEVCENPLHKKPRKSLLSPRTPRTPPDTLLKTKGTEELLQKVSDRLVPISRTLDMERYEDLRRYHSVLQKIAPGHFDDVPLRIPPTQSFLELMTEEERAQGLEVMGYYNKEERTISLHMDMFEEDDPEREKKILELLFHEGAHALEHSLRLKSAFSTLEHTPNYKLIHDTMWARAWDQQLVSRDTLKWVSEYSRTQSWGMIRQHGLLDKPLERTDWLNKIVDIPSYRQPQRLGLDRFPFPTR